MAKTNAERQEAWRQRARDAREFQRQHAELKPGWVAVPQRTLDWYDREIERLQRLFEEQSNG
jgi:hypothetical protein